MYTIYEIPGVKIGCDYAWPLRAKEQGVNVEDCIILQEESDIIQVSIDEMWWQIEKGYPVDLVPYFQVVENNRKRASSGGKKGGPIGGKIAVESGQLASIRSRESQSKGGKGKIWINDGIKNKRIYPNDLDKYQQLGFSRGRIKNW